MGIFKKLIKFILVNVVIYRINSKKIYLTFDDGPVPKTTLRILNYLKEQNIKATFFVEGCKAEKSPQMVLDMIRDGHAVGYHSFFHRPIDKYSWKELQELCLKIKRFYERYDPDCSQPFFRPPYGKLSFKSVVAFWINRIKIYMWSIDSLDSHHIDEKSIIHNLDPMNIKSGDIILMHDDSRISVDALPIVINRLKTAGFRFGTFR